MDQIIKNNFYLSKSFNFNYFFLNRSLKDSRRRISQTVLSKVGSADETKDIHYDTHVHKFHSMIDDMNQCKML